MGNEIAERAMEVMAPGALRVVHDAELDGQFAMAQKRPRILAVFRANAIELATTSPAVAASMRYILPFKDDKGNYVQGPSVRLAEVLVHTYGNLRVSGRIVAETAKTITAEGVCMDLQTNNGYRIEVTRNIVRKDGTRYSQDQIAKTGQAAIAIATRNATFKTIPRALFDDVYQAAFAATAPPEKDLSTHVAGMFKALKAAHKIGKKELLKFLGRTHDKDVTREDMQRVGGLLTAIEEGLTTAEAAFKGKPAAAEKPSPKSDLFDDEHPEEKPAGNAGGE